MSRHARVEELPDSESDSDPSEQDPAELLAPANPATNVAALPRRPAASAAAGASPAAVFDPQTSPAAAAAAQRDAQRHKAWASLYPVYFDAQRSRAEGRRVGKGLGVPNPLAREIADACAAQGLNVHFEPGKAHPKDWANPGRVKVELRAGQRVVKNKHHLYILVARYLQAHPATPETPLKVRVPGLPARPVPPPRAPRGWKLSAILPLHSPAVSDREVSENMFRDMMAELQQAQEGAGGAGAGMGGGLPGMMGGLPGMGGGGGGLPGMMGGAPGGPAGGAGGEGGGEGKGKRKRKAR